MKLTGWYKEAQKPIRKGVYQRYYEKIYPEIAYCYWDGYIWYWVGFSIEEAIQNFELGSSSSHQNLKWRGIAK